MNARKELALDWLAFFIIRRNGRLGKWAMDRVVTKWIIAPGVPLEEPW